MREVNKEISERVTRGIKMQRQIKFRCWDIYNKEMLDVQELDYENSYNGQPMVRTTMYNDYFDTEDMILMQYTELHDKNGKEIYEGDIVQIRDINSKVVDIKPIKAVIDWSEEYLSYILLTTSIKDAFENLGDYLDFDIEVIGNIYENSELLERSSNDIR